MWMIFARATELLCERGTPPLIWDSMQMPGRACRKSGSLRWLSRLSDRLLDPQ